jgi:hypothetical protein
MKQDTLLVGTAVATITPPLEVGLLTSAVEGRYAPFESVRLPLKARVLAMTSENKTIIIVALDLLALSDTSVGGWQQFKQSLTDRVPSSHLIVTCTHTHTAPESVALSELYLTYAFRDWLNNTVTKIRNCIDQAIDTAVPCRLMYGGAILEGHHMQRRIPSPSGILMSDAVQPVSPALLNRDPVDKRVRALQFIGKTGKAVATVLHAVCHPVHEMCMPHISPDFPGELCNLLERNSDHGTVLFLNGAAGDINPPTVSCGAGTAYAHAEALAHVFQQEMIPAPFLPSPFEFVHHEQLLGCRPHMELTNMLDSLARIGALAFGPDLAVVFLPGEPFVEIGFYIEKHSPFTHTLVVCFAENTVGYIPTTEAFTEGGYEVGPGKWSFLEKGTDRRIEQMAIDVLQKLKNEINEKAAGKS